VRQPHTQAEDSTGWQIRTASDRWPHYWPRELDGRFVELAPSSSPGKTALQVGLFALIWNAITWTISFFLWREGAFSESWIILVFVGFFLVFGLVLIGVLVSQVLAAVRTRAARLAIERPALLLGDRVRVLVGQDLKGFLPVNKFTMTLLCREWVRYRQGTDTKTDTRTVHEVTTVLLEPGGQQQSAPLSAEAEIEILADAMHSFEAADNKIEWLVKITLDVPNWPNTDTEFKLSVVPRLALPAAPAKEEAA